MPGVVHWRWATLLCLAALLGACGSAPRGGAAGSSGASQRDGPPANPPPDLIDRPDAEPRVEPIRTGGPNKPYVVLGQAYTPLASDDEVFETGLASWYGRKFHGRPTANGEIFDMYGMTAAHRTMPLPSYALVRNPANGREVVVRINDRGPFHRERVIDLSYAAALKLGVLRGVAPVEVRRLTHDDIRSGQWRGVTAQRAPAPAPAPEEAVTAPPPAPVPASVPAPATAAVAVEPAPAVAAPVATTVAVRAPDATSPAFWVQLGAFRQQQGAFDLREQLMRELAWLEPLLAVFDDSALFRVQAGPFASRSDAASAARQIRGAADRLGGTTGWQPLVVLRP